MAFGRASIGVADGAGEPILEDGPLGVDGPADVDISGSDSEMVDGARIEEGDDGSAIVDLDPQLGAESNPEIDFTANIAAFMEISDRDAIASDIVDAVAQDKESRAEWEGALADGIKLLGLRIEERTTPFQGACGVFDPVMAEAVIRFQAIARGELLPAEGPVKTEIIGSDTDENRDRSSRVKQWMNLYLTQLAPEYYPDFDQMLMWLPLVGSTFKKVYQDPILGRPVSQFIIPDNFIVPYTAVDLMTTPRATQILPMNRKDLRERQIKGVYLDIDLGEPAAAGTNEQGQIKQEADQASGVSAVVWRGDEQHTIYECHLDLDLQDQRFRAPGAPDGLPLPYIVTLDLDTKKCLGIYRNWREGDDRFLKRQYFVHYKFIPGLGFYGIGYAHILGGTAKAGTMLRRQMIDAATLANFPGGLRVKGMRVDDNNIGIGPTEFREIDTAGLPIQQAVMTMPYKGPSEVSLMLMKDNTDGGRSLASNAEVAVGEGRQDAPVGTTVALLEAATRVQSGVMKRGHESFGRELKMIAELFGEYLPEQPYPFYVRGGQSAIMRSDFRGHVDVIPVSDPNITSSAQRMMRAEALLRTAQQAPQIHNMREAYQNLYTEMGVPEDKIVKMLPMPQQAQPLDPLTENQNALNNTPLKAGPAQDHDAHIQSHQPLAEMPNMAAHIAEHLGMKMRGEVENILGVQLPPAGQPLPPEVENQIAMLVAQAMQALKQQQPGANEPSPGQIMLEQLKVQAKQVVQRAQEAQQKAAAEKYKADLKYAADMAKIQSQETQTRIKAYTQLHKPQGGAGRAMN